VAAPRPKPAALRALEGGTARTGAVSKRPMPARVELGGDLDEKAPAELGREGRQLWRDVVVGLIRLGLVTEVDRPAAVALCLHWQRMRRAERVLERQGYFVPGSMWQMVAHPALRIANDASTLFLRHAVEFGLTPSARVGLGLADAARRTLQHDLDEKLGYNPRRT